jgi:hypothetical protein
MIDDARNHEREDTFYTLRKITDEDCVKIKQKINIVITKPTHLLSM